MSLRNTTGNEMKIYLKGFASEEKRGMIVDGQSKLFNLPVGEKNYGYNDFKDGTVNWINKELQTILLRTGNAPSGNYTICVTAFNEEGEIVGQENCIEQSIELTFQQEITLITPVDEEKVNLKENLTFSWTPMSPLPKEGYILKAVEINGNQSVQEAISKNSVWFTEKDLKTTTFQYPLTAKKFEVKKKYAWQVTAKGNDKNEEIVKSDVWSFIIISPVEKEESVIKPPIINLLKFYYELNEEPNNRFVEVDHDTLDVQFINNYISSEKVTFKIYDDSKSLVNKNKENSLKNALNVGLNRISIGLKSFNLLPNKYYLLQISDYKKNYYINFKITRGYEK